VGRLHWTQRSSSRALASRIRQAMTGRAEPARTCSTSAGLSAQVSAARWPLPVQGTPSSSSMRCTGPCTAGWPERARNTRAPRSCACSAKSWSHMYLQQYTPGGGGQARWAGREGKDMYRTPRQAGMGQRQAGGEHKRGQQRTRWQILRQRQAGRLPASPQLASLTAQGPACLRGRRPRESHPGSLLPARAPAAPHCTQAKAGEEDKQSRGGATTVVSLPAGRRGRGSMPYKASTGPIEP
jgi:hypothetical protein